MAPEEKLELRNWLANTLSEEIKDVAVSLLDVLDDETIASKTKLPIEKIKQLRERSTKTN